MLRASPLPQVSGDPQSFFTSSVLGAPLLILKVPKRTSSAQRGLRWPLCKGASSSSHRLAPLYFLHRASFFSLSECIFPFFLFVLNKRFLIFIFQLRLTFGVLSCSFQAYGIVVRRLHQLRSPPPISLHPLAPHMVITM